MRPPLGVQTLYIVPVAPWENGCSESPGCRLRDDLLNREPLTNVLEAQVITAGYRGSTASTGGAGR